MVRNKNDITFKKHIHNRYERYNVSNIFSNGQKLRY